MVARNTPSIFVGDRFKVNNGEFVTVIKYYDSYNIDIVFDGSKTIIHKVAANNLRNGKIKDVNRKSVCGVGFIGNGKYISRLDNKMTAEYAKWSGMINRCYGDKSGPAYVGASVDEKWFSFQHFADWYCSPINKKMSLVRDVELDKDLLGSNSVYSEFNCVLLPRILNLAIKNGLKQGVSKVPSNKYRVVMSKYCKHTYIGTYDTKIEGEQVYARAKLDYISELAIEYKNVLEDRAFDALMNWKPKQDYSIN